MIFSAFCLIVFIVCLCTMAYASLSIARQLKKIVEILLKDWPT